MSKKVIVAMVLPLSLLVAGMYYHNGPRAWPTGSVPIAFWTWRNDAPGQADVDRAFAVVGSRTLFIHAGQLDVTKGTVSRIRPVAGHFPRGVETHLVYNATHNLLREWENIDLNAAATAVAEAFADDSARATADGAQISGLQLDLDIPDRLLSRYRELLHMIRGRLPVDTKISITGLASWTNSKDLPALLSGTDFWLPQFYGYDLAMRSDEKVPIGSVDNVGLVIDRVRDLDRPYYAGLASFAYTTLYDKSGTLDELRGDIGPADILGSGLFELRSRSQVSGEMRCEFVALKDGVLAGLTIEPGDLLVFQMPTAASLAAAANTVRERGGEALAGICLFRLPTKGDAAALTIEEIQAAVLNVATHSEIDLDGIRDEGGMTIDVSERGSARSAIGGSVTVDIRVPIGSMRDAIESQSYSTLCGSFIGASECSPRRADLLRLNIPNLDPGSEVRIRVPIDTELPRDTQARVLFQTNDGRVEAEFVNLHFRTVEK